MTKEQLDNIRARHAEGFAPRMSDATLLLAEVERLRDAHAMAVQVSGELCEKCGWAMRFPGEKCRCDLLAEVERLNAIIVAVQNGRDKAKEHVVDEQRRGEKLRAEVERLTAELHRMKSRPVEAEFSRLDTMWQQLVRERDEAVHELRCLKGDRSEVNTAKLNDAFTEGTLKAGDAMRPLIADAFQRGVAAMREAAVGHAYFFAHPSALCGPTARAIADEIRALPDPEDKP